MHEGEQNVKECFSVVYDLKSHDGPHFQLEKATG